jgi:hypothetical protein
MAKRGPYAKMTFQKLNTTSKSFEILKHIALCNIDGVRPSRKTLIEKFGPAGVSSGWYGSWFSDALYLGIIANKGGYILLPSGYAAIAKVVVNE